MQSRRSIAAQIQKARTPAEELRATLDRLDAALGKLNFSERHDLEEVPLLYDRAHALMAELQERGANLASERSRYETLSSTLRQKAALFARRMGGSTELVAFRAAQPAPPPEAHWWWYLDRYLAEQQQQRRQRMLRSLLIVVVVTGVLVGLYMLFLAPDEETRTRFRYQQQAERALLEGDLDGAREAITEALNYVPENPELLILLGIIEELSGAEEAADAAYTTARQQVGDEEQFLLMRAQSYLRTDVAAGAYQDAEDVIARNPESAEGYFYRGMANVNLGNLFAANEDLEEASRLADEQDKVELQGMARVQLANLTMMMLGPAFTPTPTPE